MARFSRNYCNMTTEHLYALMTFAFVTSITPGPNNLMLMASGANFGFRRTLPHMLGVGLGFVFVAIIMGLGLAQLFQLYPIINSVLKVVSITYLLWLAWKIAHSAAPENKNVDARPLTFLQAAAFQWVNPKVWFMALTALTVYAPGDTFTDVLLVAAVFGSINLPAVSSWCLLGREMRRVLTNRKRLNAFNWGMAFLLVASLYPVIF